MRKQGSLKFDLEIAGASNDRYLSAGATMLGDYRFHLTRVWAEGGTHVLFILFNPSTADGLKDDPTLLRCVAFAKSWGYTGLVIENLFALRSSTPAALEAHPDPIGNRMLNDAGNDEMIRNTLLELPIGVVVAGWGAIKLKTVDVPTRVERVKGIVRSAGFNFKCMGYTSDGSPKHPLARGKHRIPDDVRLLDYGGEGKLL